MTNAQLRQLLQEGARQMKRHNQHLRKIYAERITDRIYPRSISLQLAKADMWMAKVRKATKRRVV